jgi:hypothetical protein
VTELLGTAAAATFSTSNAQYIGDPSASGIVFLTDPSCTSEMTQYVQSDAIVLTTGALAIAAATNNTRIDAGVDNAGVSTTLINGGIDPDTGAPATVNNAAVLSFTLTPKVNGALV